MTEWVSLRISAELKARVDEARGDVPLARWVARACEARLPQLDVVERLDAVIAESRPVLDRLAPGDGGQKFAVLCPECEWVSPDPAARCPTHDRRKKVA